MSNTGKKIKKFSTKMVQLRNFTNQTFKFKSGDICRPQSVSVPLFQDELVKVLTDAKLDYTIEGNIIVVGEEQSKDGNIGEKELDILIDAVTETIGDTKAVIKGRKAKGFSNGLLDGELKALIGLQKNFALQKDGNVKAPATSSEAERILKDAKKWLMMVEDLTPPTDNSPKK